MVTKHRKSIMHHRSDNLAIHFREAMFSFMVQGMNLSLKLPNFCF